MELFTRHLGPGTLRTRAFAPLALFSLVVLARPAIAQMCSESNNYVIGSGSLKAQGGVEAAGDCCSLCYAHGPECKAYTWDSVSRECTLKDNTNVTTVEQGKVSGATSPLPYELRCANETTQPGVCNVCSHCCTDGLTSNQCSSCAANCRNVPWPGELWARPRIHYSPPCMRLGGWHDIAGALTYKGAHHVFPGCDAMMGGWHHGVTEDLVHYREVPGAPRRVVETYAGMYSYMTPCSGFVTVDDDGVACAGFRQCGSDRGVEGGQAWDVPMEIRCAKNDNLNEWGDPIYLFNVSYYRPVPYDPPRPWKDLDGNWYMLLSLDACNGTTDGVPCAEGAAVGIFKGTDRLHGKGARWERLGTFYKTNKTVIKEGHQTRETTTAAFAGAFFGDPYNYTTRVLFNNPGGNGGGEGCCDGNTDYTVGKAKNGGPFVPYEDVNYNGGLNMLDWGGFGLNLSKTDSIGVEALRGDIGRGFAMARPFGSDPNQVTVPGRRVIVGWHVNDNGANAVSLTRELTLSDDLQLLQQFVPEYESLRIPQTYARTVAGDGEPRGHLRSPVTGQQIEVVARFEAPGITAKTAPFGVRVLGCPNQFTEFKFWPEFGLFVVDATQQGNKAPRAGPLPLTDIITMHAIVDRNIIEVIVNNRTALTVSTFPGAEECGGVSLFGVEENGVRASMDVWQLEDANNIV